MLVADTNLIAYLNIEGKFTRQAELIFLKDNNWIVPFLWRSEFCNILATYLRQKIITLETARINFATAQTQLADNEYEVDPLAVIDECQHTGLSASEAEYVVLAQKLGLPLVTNDRKILETHPGFAVRIADYL